MEAIVEYQCRCGWAGREALRMGRGRTAQCFCPQCLEPVTQSREAMLLRVFTEVRWDFAYRCCAVLDTCQGRLQQCRKRAVTGFDRQDPRCAAHAVPGG